MNCKNESLKIKAIKNISKSFLLSTLSDLVKFDSHENETPLAEYLAKLLRSIGFEATLDEVVNGRCNVVGKLKGNDFGNVLIFNSHLDTVSVGECWESDPFTLRIKGELAYGRGSCDAKGCIAAFLTAVEAIRKIGISLKGNLIFAGVVDEEKSSQGTRKLIKNVKADMAIVGEPGFANKIGVAHKGSFRPIVEVIGKAAHSGTPEKGINAIEQMALLISELPNYRKKLSKKKHPFCGSPVISATIIKGGMEENIIPAYCEMVIDRRLIPGENEKDVLNDLFEFFKQVKGINQHLKIKIDRFIPTTGSSSEIDTNATIVQIFKRAIEGVENDVEVELYGRKGTCDMVHLINAGIPTVIYGPGDPSLAHKPNEYVSIVELLNAAKVYTNVLIEILC